METKILTSLCGWANGTETIKNSLVCLSETCNKGLSIVVVKFDGSSDATLCPDCNNELFRVVPNPPID